MIETYDQKTVDSLELDEIFSKLSLLVCEHGPQLLTLGMSQLEANRAILACLETLLSRARIAERMSKEAHEFKSEALRELQAMNDKEYLKVQRLVDEDDGC
jgi:hypothetical protein